MMSRRMFLGSTAAAAALAALGYAFRGGRADAEEKSFEIAMSDTEWKRELTPEQFRVLRGHATERASSSPLDREKRAGLFHCAGCDLPVYSSEAKFDSGTGWPSFYAPLDNAIGTSEERSFFDTRIEVHCRRCGGHLGHVFDDGPPPTGKRYCMNGVAMHFIPADA